MSAGSLYVPPAPGIMPSRVSGSPTCAVDAKTRMLVQRASSRPPPRARELIALMVGIGRMERAVKVLRRLARKAAVLLVELANCPAASEADISMIVSVGYAQELRNAYSSAENPPLSFRSAPAQKQLSTSLASTTALVGPL